MTQKYLNELTHVIIGAAIEVHKELGPGLLESIYGKCMTHVLRESGLIILVQQKVPLVFRGLYLDCDLRLDLLVDDSIIVEIKASDCFLPIHETQLMTYLKLMKKP
jgi:GxxExxY protein